MNITAIVLRNFPHQHVGLDYPELHSYPIAPFLFQLLMVIIIETVLVIIVFFFFKPNKKPEPLANNKKISEKIEFSEPTFCHKFQ